jgi:hypothetical protein
MQPCTPATDYDVFLYGARRVLLVLHAASAVVLIGAATHHALQMRHYLRGNFGRSPLEKIYAQVIAVSFPLTFALGAILYPSYRYHVRGLYLDRYAPWAARLFDVKEMLATLTLLIAIGLGGLARTLRPREQREFIPIYVAMSLIVCVVVWIDAIAGVLVTSVRGIG